MNDRLLEIIRYKTGGKRGAFAELMGWSAPYLTKLLNGENFGLQPVLAILSAFPEINARWFLFGQGEMLEIGKMFDLQRQAMSQVMSVFDLGQYVPFMSGDEIGEFHSALTENRKPDFSPERIEEWARLLSERNADIDARFAAATAKATQSCKQKIVRK